jgi:hypothetical protein
MIIWGGLEALSSDAAKSDPNFAWQLILFTFVIAALVLAINPNVLSDERQRAAFKTTGFMMIFSGVIMFGGYGLLLSGLADINSRPLIGAISGLIGMIILMTSWVLLALGLSIMAVESAQILLDAVESSEG